MSLSTDLFNAAKKLADRAEKLSTTDSSVSLEALERAAERAGKAWSGSWIGYQSRVYYKGLNEPPPRAL
jgi:hypothetical protein